MIHFQDLPSFVKLKSAGRSLPFGNLAPSTRSSSKNSCTKACTALQGQLTITYLVAVPSSRQSGRWRVFEQVANECDSIWGGSWSEDLCEWVGFDLGELVFHVLDGQLNTPSRTGLMSLR